MNALSGTIPCTFAWSLVLTSCSKCASRFTQVTALSWGWHACRKQDGSHSAHFVRTAGCFFKDLNWRSLSVLGQFATGKIDQNLQIWHQPRLWNLEESNFHIYIYMYIYNTYMIIDSMLAGNHQAAHFLYSTKFHRPSLAFLRAPVFHDFTNTQKTDPYWHVPIANQHSYRKIIILKSVNQFNHRSMGHLHLCWFTGPYAKTCRVKFCVPRISMLFFGLLLGMEGVAAIARALKYQKRRDVDTKTGSNNGHISHIVISKG